MRTLMLSRPERRNALDLEHLRLLEEALSQAAETALVRCVVVTGEGAAFCAGYDLSTPLLSGDELTEAPDVAVIRTMAAVRACAVPTIARVNGPAFGAGLELAISCDVRIAADGARLCLPPAKLGIAYAPEGLARLAQLVGTSRARRMAFSAEVVPADRALAIGLVDEVTADLDARVQALADQFADAAPLAVRAMKRTFDALETALSPALRARAELDRLACYESADAQEGVAAFAQKRPPTFEGR